ncbi:MAG: HNH endonuclease [Verrucomicrobia bacterium]|nr:HNH endonuclease [Verrucomicrobiota bacterium]
MAKRKTLSKRVRFEVFKRDRFQCLYCGATPAQKVLRVDHVVPVVEGGGNEPANLATACFDCNAGKAGVPLSKASSGFATDADKEHAEQIRAWLEVQKEIDAARAAVGAVLVQRWEVHLGGISTQMAARMSALAREFTVDSLDKAMQIVAWKIGRQPETWSPHLAMNQQKYFSGILRKWRTHGVG